MRGYAQAAKDIEEIKPYFEEIDSCQYGLWTNGLEFFFLKKKATKFQVAAALTDVPGSSAAFRGGVVAYATELKADLLGVDAMMLRRHGAVYPPVAAAMAEGVRARLGATYGVATTGVAGPEPSDGQPVGTAHIAVSVADDTVVRTIALTGDRHEIRRLTVEHALGLLLGRLREESY